MLKGWISICSFYCILFDVIFSSICVWGFLFYSRFQLLWKHWFLFFILLIKILLGHMQTIYRGREFKFDFSWPGNFVSLNSEFLIASVSEVITYNRRCHCHKSRIEKVIFNGIGLIVASFNTKAIPSCGSILSCTYKVSSNVTKHFFFFKESRF